MVDLERFLKDCYEIDYEGGRLNRKPLSRGDALLDGEIVKVTKWHIHRNSPRKAADKIAMHSSPSSVGRSVPLFRQNIVQLLQKRKQSTPGIGNTPRTWSHLLSRTNLRSLNMTSKHHLDHIINHVQFGRHVNNKHLVKKQIPVTQSRETSFAWREFRKGKFLT